MTDTAAHIITLDDVLTVDAAQELLPIWTDWGVEDYQVMVHSIGVTFWTLLGQRCGTVAVSEMPAPTEAAYRAINRDVRSDSIWFNKATRQPLLIAEFERYKGITDEAKLVGKIECLLIAHHRWGEQANDLVLAYWTDGLKNTPDHERLRSVVRDGFRASTGEFVRGVDPGRLRFYQFIMRGDIDGRLRLSEIVRRGTP